MAMVILMAEQGTERMVRVLPREAIRMFCFECFGLSGNIDEIGRCTCIHCPFYVFRPTQRKNRGHMTEKQLQETRGYEHLTPMQKSAILTRDVNPDSTKRGNPNWVKGHHTQKEVSEDE
jgi:hypothetical protein